MSLTNHPQFVSGLEAHGVDRVPRRSDHPRNTYRLQISQDFDLHAAAQLVPYLSRLGVDWIYLSPLLSALSDHGYDVVDHQQVDPRRGGGAGLAALAEAAHGQGIGVLVDIVPNHVGVASPVSNAWWWDVLTHGRSSALASAFDIDWDAGNGRLVLPVLGDDASDLDDVLVVVGNTELRYHDLRVPLRPGTVFEGRSPSAIHDQQHYRLVHWSRAAVEINYRRFFTVSSLAAIRVEEPWVFAESHREILRWIDEGLVDGLRVDHPDGLFDPSAYLAQLAAATGGVYTVVEKILEGDERLPPSWPVHGTTGYEALADIDRVLVDDRGREALDHAARRVDPSRGTWAEEMYQGKRSVADTVLRAEVERIARELVGAVECPAAHDDMSAVVEAVAEIAACLPVYRTYLPDGVEHLRAAVAEAAQRRPGLGGVLERVGTALADPQHPAALRFQQTSGMIMAKGVEDRSFYRFNRLGSLTEVGGDPDVFAISPEEFHQRRQRDLAAHPSSMTTLTTHDTKRGEDVRSRLNVLSETGSTWTAFLDEVAASDAVETLIWQAIIGSWPATRQRLHDYAVKAAREAALETDWSSPSDTTEARLRCLVDRAFDDPDVNRLVVVMVATLQGPGWSNSLAAKVLQLCGPGVPDCYQGSELWHTSLVDPDNRRPVDFELRQRLLADVDRGEHPRVDPTGRAKLLVVSRCLRARRDRPELFSVYRPLTAHGPAADHVVAFDRGGAIVLATRLPVGLAARGGWADTAITLPQRPMRDAFTGRLCGGGIMELDALLGTFPVALLLPEDGAR